MIIEQRVQNLEAAFDAHRLHTEQSSARILELEEENQRQLGKLIEESRGLLHLYRDVQSVGRVGVRLQNFLAWVAKWPLIGGGVYVVLDYIFKNFR